MKIFQVMKRIYHKVVDSFSLFKPRTPRHNRRVTLPSRKEKISIKYRPIEYRPMKEVDKILFPNTRFLYVLTYQLEVSGYRNFYVKSKRLLTQSELERVSAQTMINMIDDGSYKYEDDDMPIASSMRLAVAYRRE